MVVAVAPGVVPPELGTGAGTGALDFLDARTGVAMGRLDDNGKETK